MPCEIWGRIGTLLLPDTSVGTYAARRALHELLDLGLACSDLNSALAPTREAGRQLYRRIRLKQFHLWPAIQDELLCDGLLDESGHSTYFSVVCDRRDRPLLYYDGPEGKWVCTAHGLLGKLNLRWNVRGPLVLCTVGIIDILAVSIDHLSVLVTTAREHPTNQLVCDQVASEDVQLFSLVEANVDVIADAIIRERHPWNVPEVFDFYSLAFKPISEAVMLAYKEFVSGICQAVIA